MWLASAAPAAHAADVMSVQEFLESESKFDGYVKLSTRLKVEGRYTSISPILLRLSKCQYMFRVRESKELPKVTSPDANLLVEGVLEKTGGKFQFVVDAMRQMPSDEQMYFDRERKLDRTKSDGWFELGDWALARGSFYEDKALSQLGTKAHRQGITIERNTLPRGSAAARRTLADTGKKYGLGDEFHAELVHEAFRIDRDQLLSAKSPDFQALIDRIERELPGARDPLTMVPADLEMKYRSRPLSVFNESDFETRKKLYRLLRNELVFAQIEGNARPDGSNGSEIASQIEDRLPEWHGKADEYRAKELDYKLTQVGNYSQQQAVALAEQFETRGKPEKAQQAREKWLAERSQKVDRNDPEAVVFLADQYETLLGDQATAIRLLLAAVESHPDSTEVATALGRHGYSRIDGKWLSAAEVTQRPVDPIEQAIREGRIERGMTRLQVEKSLGKPTNATRIATRGAVSEVWVYRQKGVDRVTVRFERAGGSANEPRVVESF